MGCAISPTLFVMAMHVILDTAISWMPEPSPNGEGALPVRKAFMDDTKILTPEVSYAHDIPARQDELISGCRMSFKPKESRNVSIVKVKVSATEFYVTRPSLPGLSNLSKVWAYCMMPRWQTKKKKKMQYNTFETWRTVV